MSSAETFQLTDCELIDSLRCFPVGVLPVGVLRELTQRGPKIQDEVLRRLDKAVSDAGTGIGCIPRECFYCFGLLIAHPCVEQLPTLERLLRLDHEILDSFASDLSHDVPGTLIVEIAKGDGSTEEVRLRTYESARQLDQLHGMVLRALTAGVSGREMSDVHPTSPGVSKSSVCERYIRGVL